MKAIHPDIAGAMRPAAAVNHIGEVALPAVLAAVPYDRRLAPALRHNAGGNYCGHRPATPRLDPAVRPVPGCPYVLRKAIERLRAYYEHPGTTLPELDVANRSARQTRSEAREAQIAWMSTLLLHTELSTMRVGRPTRDGFRPYTHDTLADRAGLSLTRALRASGRWIRSGYLDTAQHRERNADGGWTVHPAARLVSERLFERLGLGFELKRARKAAARRRQREADAAAVPLTTLLCIAGMVEQSRSRLRRRHARQRPLDLGTSVARATATRRARWIADTLVRLRREHPDWDDPRLMAAIKDHPDYA